MKTKSQSRLLTRAVQKAFPNRDRKGAVLALAGMAALAANAAPATFNKDVLPILQKHCQECHRPGEMAPMSLLSYTEARPWAKAIKAAVVTEKMPPWFAESTATSRTTGS